MQKLNLKKKKYNIKLHEHAITESLTPLRGQLLAAFRLNPPAGPPLSVVNIIIELSSIPLSLNAFVTLPTDSSKRVTIAEMLSK